jgi:hypothetical protein
MNLRDPALSLFADYYGFDYERLAGNDRYHIENAPFGYVGEVEAIRIVRQGRFGNIFYQLLHAVLVARQIGCRTIQIFPFPGCPQNRFVQIDDLRIVIGGEPDASVCAGPTLVGGFFNSYPFESTLRGVRPDAVWAVIKRYIRPLFAQALSDATPLGATTVVCHFRSGDIFSEEHAHSWYVQPPACYYTRAIAFARAELGVRDVRLVFEDRQNPAIAATEAFLDRHGIPFMAQSGSFQQDFGSLAAASHLVTPFSTFGEVAALLSTQLKTYIAFRRFESHQHIHQRTQPLLLGVLRQKNVRPVLIDDAAGAYIAPCSWDGSAAQRRLIRDYPSANLAIHEDHETIDARETALPDAILRAELHAAREEAARLRRKLVVSRNEIHGSVSWRVTAPIRWGSTGARRLLGR